MIKTLFTAAALAAALGAGGAAQAALITFNDPGLVDIGGSPQLATYAEAGYIVSGPVASFQPIDQRLAGGFDTTPFSLMLAGGGDFSLLALDYDFYDLGFGDANSTLTITGLLFGSTVATRTVNLAGTASLVFGAPWARVTEVRFSADAGFTLDNISAVPEPSTLALSSAGVLALALRGMVRRRRA